PGRGHVTASPSALEGPFSRRTEVSATARRLLTLPTEAPASALTPTHAAHRGARFDLAPPRAAHRGARFGSDTYSRCPPRRQTRFGTSARSARGHQTRWEPLARMLQSISPPSARLRRRVTATPWRTSLS